MRANARNAAEPPSAEVLAKADALTARIAALVVNEELRDSSARSRAKARLESELPPGAARGGLI